MGHPVDEGDGPTLAPKGRNGLPHSDAEFLNEIMLVRRLGEGAAYPVQNAEMRLHPFRELIGLFRHASPLFDQLDTRAERFLTAGGDYL